MDKKLPHLSPKRLLTVRNSADYLGRSVYGLRTLIWSGHLPIVRDGRKIFLDVRDLDSYIEKNKITYSLRPEDERPENGRRKNG